ncbi:MAG: PA0069 family radical SAM protein [Spirochaetia bacterium]|nr:PA0069 family radical SAM protein [Spirochaetia bacterium]
MLRGRGITRRFQGRFESIERVVEPVTEAPTAAAAARTTLPSPIEDEFSAPISPATVAREEKARSIIMRNTSPDVPFDQSLNPYRGCEHGCVYCYARPAHSFVDLSPGIDFETQIFYKANAVECLTRELSKRAYVCSPLAIGGNTDVYQPLERKTRITRSILEFLNAHNHPLTIITKSGLIARDIDVLTDLASRSLAATAVSVTTLDHTLASKMEPRAASPKLRLQTIEKLAQAGIPVSVMVAPVIPGLNDHEMERILAAASSAGAQTAGYIVLRLPHEVSPLFTEWLDQEYPEKSARTKHQIEQMRDGNMTDSRFTSRMRGTGKTAQLLNARFRNAARRYGLDNPRRVLDTSAFIPPIRPARPTSQMSLFGESQ